MEVRLRTRSGKPTATRTAAAASRGESPQHAASGDAAPEPVDGLGAAAEAPERATPRRAAAQRVGDGSPAQRAALPRPFDACHALARSDAPASACRTIWKPGLGGACAGRCAAGPAACGRDRIPDRSGCHGWCCRARGRRRGSGRADAALGRVHGGAAAGRRTGSGDRRAPLHFLAHHEAAARADCERVDSPYGDDRSHASVGRSGPTASGVAAPARRALGPLSRCHPARAGIRRRA